MTVLRSVSLTSYISPKNSAHNPASIEDTDQQFSITYGLGSAAMTAATDRFEIAGLTVNDFAFGSAHTVSLFSANDGFSTKFVR
jgi:hypothetical protein